MMIVRVQQVVFYLYILQLFEDSNFLQAPMYATIDLSTVLCSMSTTEIWWSFASRMEWIRWSQLYLPCHHVCADLVFAGISYYHCTAEIPLSCVFQATDEIKNIKKMLQLHLKFRLVWIWFMFTSQPKHLFRRKFRILFYDKLDAINSLPCFAITISKL